MAHITLSVPDEIYTEMKKHPEIKWSEVARQNIITKVLSLKKTMKAKDFLALLDPKTQKWIKTRDEKQAVSFYTKMKEKEWMRTKYLIQV